MKTKLLSLLCGVLSICLSAGCSDEDSGIRFLKAKLQGDIVVGEETVSHLNLMSLSTTDLILEGGSAPYQVTVDNSTLLTPTVESSNLHIQTHAEGGTAALTATDSKGHTATLAVTVRKQTHDITVTDIMVRVIGTDGQEADEAVTEAITQDILATSRIRPGNRIYLEANRRTDLSYEGLLRIYADRTEQTEILYEGTYTQGPAPEVKSTYFEFDYGGETELYFVGRPNADYPDIPETRKADPGIILLGRNVTSRYQARYPGVGQVTMAFYGKYF